MSAFQIQGPPADLALVKLEEQSLSGTAAIDFQSISASYKHLEIVAFLRGVAAVNEEAFRVRFNNDAVTTGAGSYGSVLNAAASNANDVAGSYVLLGQVPGASAGADKYCAITITIPFYSGGDHKSVFATWGYSYNNTAATTRAGFGGGTWPVTTAINRVLIFTGSGAGQFAAGSLATLYGRT